MTATPNPSPTRSPFSNATSSSPFRHGPALVVLHWLMLLLLVAVYASIELRVLYAKGTDMRDFMKALHFMLGLAVLAMVALRLLARLSGPRPPEPPTATWAQRLAGLGHWALYGLMVGMPVLGWLVLSASGKPIPFFGLELPALIGPDKNLAHELKELHETLGVAGYWLIGLHAAAALGHHHVLKDGLMSRMTLGNPREA